MEQIDLAEFFRYYLSKIIIVVIGIGLMVVVGNVYSLIARRPLYESNTTIVLASESKDSATYTQNDLQLNQKLVSTYSQIIKSRKVMQKVIDTEGLDYTVNELSENVTVTSVQDTELIKISVNDRNSVTAMKIANDIVPVFSEEVKRIYKIDNVSVVDEAVEASKPYNINYLKENLIYILVGFVLASAIIFIIYYFDTTIKSSEIVEDKLGLTVIGIVPKEEKE